MIAKVDHYLGELFPRVNFIVATLIGTNRAVVHFSNQRGTAEQWIKEGNEVTHWARLPAIGSGPTRCGCCSASRLQPRQSAAPVGAPLRISSWSLTSLQQRLFKTGGRLIRHARYFILQLAESPLTPTLFRQILGRIERLAGHPT